MSLTPSQGRGDDNPYAAPRTAVGGQAYDDVPWYRRSNVNTAFALVGWFCFPPLLWWVCINLVTGHVYYDDVDEHGRLKTWSTANKVVAVLLLVFHAVLLASAMMG